MTSLARLKFSMQMRAFTEHGALQAANAAIFKRLAEIDRTLLAHDSALRDIYQKLLPLPTHPPEPPKREIGFHIKEPTARYHARNKAARSA